MSSSGLAAAHRTALVCALIALPAVSLAGTPKASSQLKDAKGDVHGAQLAFDGLLQTGWAEGEAGTGDGSWIELPFDRPTDIQSISVWPGNLSQGARSLREFGRPRTLTVHLVLAAGGDDVVSEIRLADGAREEGGPVRVDIPIEGKAKAVRVVVDDAFEGAVFNDTFLAEIAVNFVAGDNPGVVDKLDEWRASKAGQQAYDTNKKKVVTLFERIKAAEFGDREALAEIMDQAADGMPVVRSQAVRLVPAGYRVQALPPDQVAIEALLKLKDANGIPALEMASLRVTGKEQAKLENQVEMFYAYTDLQSGGDRNIPFWGKSGWEQGALRSFSEPMGIEVDQLGDLYVADLGNHRVQRFTHEGRVDRVWGGDPDISNVWFSADRRWYVAGSAPGDKAGRFVNPVDVAIVPGKGQDGFAVLDAKGRVQVFDDEGRVQIGWQVRSDDTLTPGVGGEGYILYAKKKIVVVWSNEVFVYNMESEELTNWQVEDGTPNAAEVLKNGKLLFEFGDEAVMYSADGFRHGAVAGGEDELGPGVESWDITVDGKNKLWAVTDTGWAIKYKKPGKIDYKVQIAEVDLVMPRFAVFDDLVYVVERDRILKVDALELRRKAELAAEEAAAAAGAEKKKKKKGGDE